MDEHSHNLPDRIPYRVQLPTAQQVAAALAILSLAGPMMMGGVPVLPVTMEDERRRQQEEIAQQSESSVGTYLTSQEAESGLALSQKRLAHVAGQIEGVRDHEVDELDVIRAANRVLSGQVEEKLDGKFRSAFSKVAWDTVDLYILRDNEEFEEVDKSVTLSMI